MDKFSRGFRFDVIKVTNVGKRAIEFKNGQKINFGFTKDRFTGSFMGTLRHECLGTFYFEDKKNNLRAELNHGYDKKKFDFD